MNKLNENRPGYKKTKVGWIPKEWQVVPFGMNIQYVKGFAFKSSDYRSTGRRVIRISDTTYDSFKEENPVYVDESKSHLFKKYELKTDDLIFSTVGSRPPMYDSMVGKVIRVSHEYETALLNQNAVLIRANKKNSCQQFLHPIFKTKRYVFFIETIIRGNANQASITLADLFSFHIPLPPLPEQKKIAEILSTWDRDIEQVGKLIDTKEKRYKWLLNELINKAGAKEGSKKVRLGELFKEVTEKVSESDIPPFSISAGIGFVSQREKWGKDIAGKQYQITCGYKRVNLPITKETPKNIHVVVHIY